LRVVSETPRGAVILPDLDLALEAGVWDELGVAGKPEGPEDPPFGRGDAVTHPQYHLKLLLNRMGVARDEVRPWHRAGLGATAPARSRAISSLFLPPFASAGWADLPAARRRLAGVRLMESAHPGAEAQAIAVLMREALEVPERRVALVTPDRALAGRVVAHLRRWGIDADDSAGRPLPQTAAGRVLLLASEVMAERMAPVPLIALLGHPLVRAGEDRAAWLEQVRGLDLALRGPRPAPGLGPLGEVVAGRPELAGWWAETAGLLTPLEGQQGELRLADLLDVLVAVCESLCGERLWGGADGRALGGFIESLREPAREVGTRLDARDLPALLRERMDCMPVRPPWGGHPRVAIYGLIEARMSRADLVICGGLVEGAWPGSPAPDPLLPPAVLRRLGVPGADFRIGLSAHDLAGALGAPEVVLSWARRDDAGPVSPSRFVLRVQAMLGEALAKEHEETKAPALAAGIDVVARVDPHPRPQPTPSPEQRRVDISATNLDRLRSDPYQFYANAILRLSRLVALDAEPSAPLRGEAAHRVLDRWHREGGGPARLRAIAEEELDKLSAHPLMRALWRPRLLAALDWVGAEIGRLAEEGRTVAGTELWGDMLFDGVRVHGRVDRIDRLADGTLAVVDYKTGMPPGAKQVAGGFTLQLGTLGLIARDGGFRERARDIEIRAEPSCFEYWSLAKDKDAFGYRKAPFYRKPKDGQVTAEDFLDRTAGWLAEAIDDWIKGNRPFTARLNPDIGTYNDYDQLMRLEEWFWSIERPEPEALP
jgi:ATP-dependent helicase/nuclease subunit B